MSRPDWLPPDGRTPEEWVTETPKARRQRRELERWKAERIAAHRRMIGFLQGRLDPDEEPEPNMPTKRQLTGSPWS